MCKHYNILTRSFNTLRFGQLKGSVSSQLMAVQDGQQLRCLLPGDAQSEVTAIWLFILTFLTYHSSFHRGRRCTEQSRRLLCPLALDVCQSLTQTPLDGTGLHSAERKSSSLEASVNLRGSVKSMTWFAYPPILKR